MHNLVSVCNQAGLWVNKMRACPIGLQVWQLFQFSHLLFFISNWGTENDADFSYHNGNSEPKGFGMSSS